MADQLLEVDNTSKLQEQDLELLTVLIEKWMLSTTGSMIWIQQLNENNRRRRTTAKPLHAHDEAKAERVLKANLPEKLSSITAGIQHPKCTLAFYTPV